MTETARWKMIATVAVAFSFGNVFAIACGTGSGGGNSANANDGNDGNDGTNPPSAALEAEVLRLGNEVASLKCFIGHMTDDQEWKGSTTTSDNYPGYWDDIVWGAGGNTGEREWDQGPNSDASKAYDDCF